MFFAERKEVILNEPKLDKAEGKKMTLNKHKRDCAGRKVVILDKGTGLCREEGRDT
jgi:hypothetical protein